MLTNEQRKMVEENMALVNKVIKDKVCFIKGSFMSLEDVYQIGYLGLCKAVLSYTPSKACFSTYAYRSILSHIMEALIFSENTAYNEMSLDCVLRESPRDRKDAQYQNNKYPIHSVVIGVSDFYSDANFTEGSCVKVDFRDAIKRVFSDEKISEKQKRYVLAFFYYFNGYSQTEAGIKAGATGSAARNYPVLGRNYLRKREDWRDLWQNLNIA